MKKISNTFIKKLCAVVLAMAVITGCHDYLDDINQDTNTPTGIDVSMRLTYAQNQVFDFVANGNNISGSLFAQYLTNGDGRSSVDVYDFTGGGSGFYLYNDGLRDIHKMYEEVKTKPVSYAHYVGVGKVMEAMALGALTDAMGDMPYSQALKGSDNIYPGLDSQEQLYQTIQTLLSDGITDLKKDSYKLKGDFLLGNDAKRWLVLAHLLKARYYNHLSKKDPVGSATNALAEIDAAIAEGWTTSTNIEMLYVGNTDHQNPYVAAQKDATINSSIGFVGDLKNSDDPRLFAYFYPLKVVIHKDPSKRTPQEIQILQFRPDLAGVSKDTTVLEIVSEEIGDPVTIGIYASALGMMYSDANASLPVFLAAEAKFIEAEAALRKGGLATRAAAAHNAAIQAHMDYVMPKMKTKLEAYKEKFAGDDAIEVGIDALLASADDQADDYVATFGAETGATITLDDVMLEKYKSMYIQGVESWTDLRRHDFKYPSYLISPRTDGKFIRRFPYPEIEKELNKASFPADDLLTKLWWDQ
ncbi:MAG: SusD/RagB family nutrient-binding outer membrane lipoprotein [Bacteroidota bacterium]